MIALLRPLDVACRLHLFTIHKSLPRAMVPETVYPLAPDSIIHSWVEVWHEGRWINLEGFILNGTVRPALKNRCARETESLSGYGAGTDCLSAPSVGWSGTDTYIQKTGINADLGLFEAPDDCYAQHRQCFGRLRGLLYRYLIRHWMNARVRQIGRGKHVRYTAKTGLDQYDRCLALYADTSSAGDLRCNCRRQRATRSDPRQRNPAFFSRCRVCSSGG